ncbi:MAG: hypothetical protein ING60_09095 [Rhodocyclaceae bacterium]|jgi:hypothetical protein|nr:hypothetical protein [Rhodocyclaceae bacterium]MCA3019556.1 hypothetical protein [Rhodocyclaceae bacterium]MCA3022396.1 hypothetical protein [Rhodocyclaceae bacterium]MCA3026127.1 hypothetical protein [Rhodocyclaceae bacterium]MCA3035959.1 hypothetical protein [Rhodocyclaceae bacterium]
MTLLSYFLGIEFDVAAELGACAVDFNIERDHFSSKKQATPFELKHYSK